MRIRAIAVTGLLIGCGSAPPPQDTAPPAEPMRTVAPSPAAANPPAPVKRLMVLFDGAVPSEEAVSREIARGSVAVDVGSSPEGMEMSLPGVMCTAAPTGMPDTRPKHFLPADLAAHDLSEADAKAIGEVPQALLVECVVDDQEMPVRGLPPMAETAASALATLTGGFVHDPQTGRYYGKQAWAAGRAETKGYEVGRNIRVIRDKNPDTGDYWLGTRGLIAFGRPDLEAFPVSEANVDAISEQLQALGDLTISEPEVASGLVMSLGPVDVLFIDRGLYANTLPAGTTGKQHDAAGESLGRLAIADPEAPQGDLDAHRAFLRRLLVR